MIVFDDIETRMAGARPCPFCGSEEIFVEKEEFWKHFNRSATLGVECKGCGAKLRGDAYESYEGAFEAALEKWNRRA